MNLNIHTSAEENMLLSLNEFIEDGQEMLGYHMAHIQLVKKYAILLNRRLQAGLSNRKLAYIGLAHDLFKERGLDSTNGDKEWRGYTIPQDTTKYVRSNLQVLEEYGLDEYFNTDIQYHALSAGIFLHTQFGINDPEILYPVMFHSCPIIEVYQTLPNRLQTMIDITMLADKLSSNYLRINMRETAVRVDLDQAVFGSSGKEFNYTLGLYLARLISQGKSRETQSVIATEYYYKRLCEMNPIISKCHSIKKLGGNTIWPKRKSLAWLMR